MTLEEKYQKLCDVLRAMAKRAGDTCYPYSNSEYCDGYCDGYGDATQYMSDAAKEALETVGEKVD